MPNQDRTFPLDSPKLQLSKIALSPGDLLVLRYSGKLTERALSHLEGLLRQEFPDHRALVLEDNMRLEAVPQDELRDKV